MREGCSTRARWCSCPDSPTTVLPSGWRDRLCRYESPAPNGVVAWCPEVHDLWLSKAAALRPKDIEFCDALLAHSLVDRETLKDRLDDLQDLDEDRRARISALIEHSAPEP